MTWTRENGVFAANVPLSAGPLQDLIHGNASHVVEQNVTDITAPICGSTLGGGVLVTGASGWDGTFTKIRPFPIPVRYNLDGTRAGLKFTMHLYSSGGSNHRWRTYLASSPPSPRIVQYDSHWTSLDGLLGFRSEVYGEVDITAAPAEYELTMSFGSALTERVDASTYMPSFPGVGGTNNADTDRTGPVIWAAFDFWAATADIIRVRAVRIQDVIS